MGVIVWLGTPAGVGEPLGYRDFSGVGGTASDVVAEPELQRPNFARYIPHYT